MTPPKGLSLAFLVALGFTYLAHPTLNQYSECKTLRYAITPELTLDGFDVVCARKALKLDNEE